MIPKIKGKQLADNTITQSNLNLVSPINSYDAATKDYVDVNKSIEHLSLANKNMVALSTVGLTGKVKACNTPIAENPLSASKVEVVVNGVHVEVGPGKGCFFSNDSGVTEKAAGTEALGDILYWDMDIALYPLESNDQIDFEYIITGISVETGIIDGGII